MRYTARKILTLLVTMLVVSLLTFAAFDMISGDPTATLLGTQATPEKVEALRTEMGLNRPMLVRYGEWLAGFFTGNLGVSFQYRQPVQALLGPKMLVTLCLSLVSFVLIVVVSLPLGLLSANGKLDGLHTFLNQFCMAVPPFFTGILISWVFGITLHTFVPGDFPGLRENFGRSLVYLFFAAVSIAIPRVAMTVRMLRSTVISEMNKPYVRTAIARGNDRRQVLWGHVLKNSMVSTVTFLGQTMAEIVAGSIVVEQVFAIPGLGRMLVASYEAIRYQKLDLFSVTLRQIGAHINRMHLEDAIEVLLNGDGNDNPAEAFTVGTDPIGGTAGTLTYDELVDFWGQFEPYEMNTLLVSGDMMRQMLKLEEFQNPLTGLNFQGTGRLDTPLGAALLRTSALGGGTLIGLDRRYALEMVQGSDVLVEYDKLIDRQLERAAITSISGFAKLFTGAAKVLKLK